MAFHLRFVLILIVLLITSPIVRSQSEPIPDPLVQVLLKKGVLSAEEARSIATNASPAEQRDRLAALLRDKGIISSDEFKTVRTDANVTATGPPILNADYKPDPSTKVAALPQSSPPAVIAAIAPVRLLGIDAQKREGLIPDIKLGAGARLKLYASSRQA